MAQGRIRKLIRIPPVSLTEFALIDRIRARSRGGDGIVLGIGDDAALLQPLAGHWLAVTADTLNSGVHFPPETLPADIGWKTLAVNLSDLAAMGAAPAWGTLALSLPHADAAWVDAFADGFFALADAHGWRLIGGDTTRGPLSLSVTAFGQVPHGRALRRDGAQVGDDIWVSGTLGDAAGALKLWQDNGLDVTRPAADADVEFLRQRLLRPTPRVELGLALQGIASAAVDISDGLLADLGHIAAGSAVGADVDATRVPLSGPLRAVLGMAGAQACALSGGDDYELCFTAAPGRREDLQRVSARLGLRLTCVGQTTAGSGVSTGRDDPGAGYQHFA
ncbi:thiamine-phosphate kinase [Stenotrophomonas tumulicola]|uniref:Thiamine-monophosphate kinase n=1 Tax=Stenotrophomonas tumulicola TaxID=1685415 RepID=A0A7W3FP41_9GAMM|nr:thiamine-phosphate kinase [Stenotrophomonas tumulicola]MBA8682816.1 thiamine-phosphate kinase [Stenotrophomonas tumulicola]